jgi:hypothetical protein
MYLPTPEDFEPWVGRNVRVEAQPYSIEVRLVRIERLKILPNALRDPYILIFESDWNLELQDNAYLFDCGRGGPYRILISQLQPKGPRRTYQAVFN